MDTREKKLIEEILDIVDCVEKGYFFLKKKCKLQDYVDGVKLVYEKLKKIHDDAPFKEISPGIAKWSKMMLSEVLGLERAVKQTLPKREKTMAVAKTSINVLHRLMERAGFGLIHAKGKAFDPKYHHAADLISRMDLDDNMVVKVFSRGYMLKDKVFKPAMVLVNQKPGKPPEKQIKADKISYDSYIKHVGFFGEMFGVKNGAKMYGDYMKIAEYYHKRVESKYSLDKFLPPG